MRANFSSFVYDASHYLYQMQSSTIAEDGQETAPSFLKSQILNRAANLGLVPVSVVCAVADTVLGALVGVVSVSTLGLHGGTNQLASDLLSSTANILVDPYLFTLKTINPYPSTNSSLVDRYGNGLLSRRPIAFLVEQANKFSRSESTLNRHVVSRLTYALLALSCVVTRVADGIIGAPAAILSILLLGKSATVNNIASRGLKATALVNDLFFCVMHFINPSAKL